VISGSVMLPLIFNNNIKINNMTETAVQYLKRMVFPYLTHEQKLLTGQFFVESENMEKQQIMKAVYDSMGTNFDPNMGRAEQYYKDKYGK
jgi:hypothetical protein